MVDRRKMKDQQRVAKNLVHNIVSFIPPHKNNFRFYPLSKITQIWQGHHKERGENTGGVGRTSKRHFDLKDFLLKKKEEEDLAVTLLAGMAGEGRANKGREEVRQ